MCLQNLATLMILILYKELAHKRWFICGSDYSVLFFIIFY